MTEGGTMTCWRRARSMANIYHVMARGVGRSIIYEDDFDRNEFLELLVKSASKSRVRVHAWCLMDNHYHILVEADIKQVSQMMKVLNGAYATYYNERHDRVGHLFQGRFKSEAIDSNSYFLTVLRYIHQNPLRAGVATTESYSWSSYSEYVGSSHICDTSLALSMLGGKAGFAAFHEYFDRTATCLDIQGTRRTLSTEEVLSIAREALGGIRPEDVASLDRQTRNDALLRLKRVRLTLRQIERITGVSKSVIARI